MENIQINQSVDNNITSLPLPELRQKWGQFWGIEPHARIGRKMLEKSLAYKMRQERGAGLSPEQQARLNQLVAAYKRNPKFFEEGLSGLKPGIRLVKVHNGEHHSVLVRTDGFEYREKIYGSLSEIASIITGTRWNGWIFFGLKERGDKK